MSKILPYVFLPQFEGTVIDVQVFTRDGVKKDRRALEIEEQEIKRYRKDLDDQLKIVVLDIFQRVAKLLIDEIAESGPNGLKTGTKVTQEYLDDLRQPDWFAIKLKNEDVNVQLEAVAEQVEQQRKDFDAQFEVKRKKNHYGRRFASGRAKNGQSLFSRQKTNSARG